MKRQIALLLVLVMALSLCACGNDTPATEATNGVSATEPKVIEEVETTEAGEYADGMFAVEAMAYEMFGGEVSHFEAKVRNTTDKEFYTVAFNLEALDAKGDVLESWAFGSAGSMEAGRGYWYDCSGRSFLDGYKSIEEVSQKVDAIRLVSVEIQTIKDDYSWKSWVEYGFKEPPTFKVADLQPKA